MTNLYCLVLSVFIILHCIYFFNFKIFLYSNSGGVFFLNETLNLFIFSFYKTVQSGTVPPEPE